ncbi:membrane protein [Candidatus Magnetomorum sp. HK-1]|nr:membrane protein [Candidatus Magnetomorum sp. HK-1]
MKYLISILFFFVGIVFIVCDNSISRILNSFMDKSAQDVGKLLGEQSIVKLNIKHVKYLGFIFIFVSVYFLFFAVLQGM